MSRPPAAPEHPPKRPRWRLDLTPVQRDLVAEMARQANVPPEPWVAYADAAALVWGQEGALHHAREGIIAERERLGR